MLGTRAWIRLAAAPVVVALAVTACGDDDEKSPMQSFVNEYCSMVSTCCESWGAKNDGGATCKMFIAYMSMGATYDAARGDACLEYMRSAQSEGKLCTVATSASTADPNPCQEVIETAPSTGTTQPGGTCDFSDDCAAPAGKTASCASYYSSDGDAGSGSFVRYCQVVTPGKEGDGPCSMTVTENGSTWSSSMGGDKVLETISCAKADGLYCDQTSQKCTAVSADGADCKISEACTTASFCSSSGKCTPDIAIGSACEEFYSDCVEGAYCDEASGECAKLKAQGEACVSMTECVTMDCTDSKCGPGFGSGLVGGMLCGH